MEDPRQIKAEQPPAGSKTCGRFDAVMDLEPIRELSFDLLGVWATTRFSDRLLFCPDCKLHATAEKVSGLLGPNRNILPPLFFFARGRGSDRQKKRNVPTSAKPLHPDIRERNGSM
jgi:hypothetical protein